MRRARGKPSEASGESAMAARAGLNRGQAFATHAAAIGKNGLPALGGITAQETVLPFPAHLRRLILSFHVGVKIVPASQKPQIVKALWGPTAPREARE